MYQNMHPLFFWHGLHGLTRFFSVCIYQIYPCNPCNPCLKYIYDIIISHTLWVTSPSIHPIPRSCHPKHREGLDSIQSSLIVR